MIPKGIGDIRSTHTINTRPGPMTEKDLLLRLYNLASQKANFQKKKEWAERQRVQAMRHLGDIQRQIGKLKKLAIVKAENPSKSGKVNASGQGWNKIPLKY